MTFKKLLLIPFLAILPALTGCGSDCESVCEDANDCPGATKTPDCGKQCDESEKAADKLGCKDQWNDVWDCAGDEDVCKADSGKACEKELNALSTCVCKASGVPAEQCTLD